MEGIARACERFRWLVVLAWVALVVALSALSGGLAGEISDDYALPGSESERAAALLRDAGFDHSAGTQAQVVVASSAGVVSGANAAAVEELAADVRDQVQHAQVVSPLDAEGLGQVSDDGEIGYVAVNLPEQNAEELAEVRDTLLDLRQEHRSQNLQVELGGLVLEQDEGEGPPSELIGIVAAIVILLVAFGSVFAMGLPILVGIIGAGSGVALVGLGANVVDMPSYASPVAAMIAIGVGIDYALLVVTRYREALHDGAAPVEAVVVAQTTAGRSVLFAGITVVIASLGLVLMDLKLITGVALGIAASVAVTMLAAVTLLPALLAIVGTRIDRWGVGRRGAPGGRGTFARRWSGQIQRRPLVWATAASAVLVIMALPVLDMRLGFSDAGTRPTSDTSRRAYDLLSEGFGAGTSGPLVLAAAVRDADDRVAVESLQERVANDSGVARVSPPVFAESGDVAVMQVVPTTGPRDEATTDLVHRLRDEVIPAAVSGAGAEVAVGGTTAAAVDFADYNVERLPVFLAVILGLALLLLMAVFRGFFVALKAVGVNLLSIGASFGAVVAVFQWGWGVELLNLGDSAPVEAWAPMMLIAIVFGLSMDYEVFLLSRIKEEYDYTGDNASAVSEGLARTARVITAAAAIMVCVFGSFVLGDSRELQLFGFGLAAAVLIDATLVRMVLVPSLMELLGDRNWWLPNWLDRRLPHLTIEGPAAAARAEERPPVPLG
jgi:putative drug exporter of the RND superfamily